MGHRSKVSRFVLSLVVVVLAAVPSTTPAASDYIDGYVEKNVDGDTIWFNTERGEAVKDGSPETRLKIRMIGIDAPETHLPSPSGVVGQGHYGDKAAAYLAKLAPLDAEVTLEDQGLDMYKRTLGRVFRDGVDVNLKMVQSGWAVPYIICSGPACDKGFLKRERVAEYLQACEDARSAGRGIFDPNDPLEEMPFEFRLRMGEREPDKWVGDFETRVLYRPDEYAKVDLCRRVMFMRLNEARRIGFDYAK